MENGFVVRSSSRRSKLQLTLYTTTPVSVDWRHALEAIPLASSYRSLNLTPNTLHSSPLANADGTLTLFQGVSSNGTPRLFYSLDQINRAKDGMRLRGVTSQEIRSSWDKSWEWKSDKVGELTRITFNNTEELRSRMADLKAKGVLREQTPAPKTEGSSAMASPAPPAHTGSGAPVDSAVSAFKKRLLASDAQLPTPSPSPSVESSPEPSSSSAPALKKLKPTLTQAQEEAKAIREAANLARYSEEFKLVRAEWLRAKKEGGAAFLSIDVEMWERSKDCLLEFGWSLVDFVKGKKGKVEERRETRHVSESSARRACRPHGLVLTMPSLVVVSEHLKRRNGRFSPDARDVRRLGMQVLFRWRADLLSLSCSDRTQLLHPPRHPLLPHLLRLLSTSTLAPHSPSPRPLSSHSSTPHSRRSPLTPTRNSSSSSMTLAPT